MRGIRPEFFGTKNRISSQENVMNSSRIRKMVFISVLAAAGLAVGCWWDANPEGKYRDSNGSVTLDLKDGKASLMYGPIRIDGTYTVDGDKLTIHPTVGEKSQTMILTINKDGSIDGPPGSDITKLQKAK
jgi:hypothetical protein